MAAKKRTMRYPNSHDAGMRLNNSIVMFKDIPVFVRQEGESIKFHLQPLDGVSRVPELVSANDEDLNIESVPLGYVNLTSPQDVVYVSRLPARKQKQGLDIGNINYFREGGQNMYTDSNGWKVPFPALAKTITGDYPSAKQAYDLVTKTKALGVAFNRKMAFSKTEDNPRLIRLRMVRDTIGFVVAGRAVPTVSLLSPWDTLEHIASTLSIEGVAIEAEDEST